MAYESRRVVQRNAVIFSFSSVRTSTDHLQHEIRHSSMVPNHQRATVVRLDVPRELPKIQLASV